VKVIIGGCGRVGATLATKLSAEGHDVVVIDKSPLAFRRLGKSFSGTTLRGMVFDKTVLDKAGADRTDAYVAVTSGDNSNVVSASIARDFYRIPKVVARIFDPRRAEIYRRLGIQTVSSVAWATNEIVSLVMSVPPRLAGRTVNDLSSPGEILPVAIVRGGASFIPTSHEVLHEGDVLEVAVLTVAMNRFESMTNP
jgi:trk system potassium uptake protein TrkA